MAISLLDAILKSGPRDQYRLLVGLGQQLGEMSPEGVSWRDAAIRRFLKIRNKDGRRVPFVPNRVQQAYANACGRKNIVLKARQLGMTTYIAARFFIASITRPGSLTVQVAHDQTSAEEIFRIVHRFLENAPEQLRSRTLKTSRANVRQLVFPRLDCEYRVETAADQNAGRGLTIQNLHCSEVARWPRGAEEVLASLRAAVPPDAEVVLESTPNGASGCFYEEWQNAEQTGYVRHFFPWWWEQRYVRPVDHTLRLNEEERELAEQFGLVPEQIAFRREMRANFRGLAKQEFAEDPATCFLASGESVFDLDQVEKRQKELPGPVRTGENGHLRVWLPWQADREYVIGVDPAGGGSEGDFSCSQVIERSSGLQCAELHGHYSPQELAGRVAELGHEYNDALVAVERNNHGHAVLAYLAMLGYPNIYEQHGKSGWLTSILTRPAILERFAATLAATPELFCSDKLLNECRSFVRRRDGSAAAASGAHDDCVMAMAIALGVRAGM